MSAEGSIFELRPAPSQPRRSWAIGTLLKGIPEHAVVRFLS